MKLPEIKGFIDLSLVDWDGKVSAVLFLPYCNLHCPFCYNTTLVRKPEEMQTILYKEIKQYLTKNKTWLDGVAITGGEPTVHNELPNLCKKIKELGLEVKLDTNGTNPMMMKKLITEKLVDYVAMDIKAPLNIEKYSQTAGVDTKTLLGEVEKTVEVLLNSSVDYEFRTTLVPTIHSKDDVKQICNRIKGCRKYVLQNFKGNAETLNPKFKNIKSFSPKDMEEFLKQAKKIVLNTFLR
jgi:pyruvate formate lyase activating enzyme